MEDEMRQTESTLADTEGNQRLSTPEKRLITVLTVLVCLAVTVVYWPVLSAKALSFDDERYFVSNPLVRNPSWGSTWRFFSEVLEPSTVGGYYQPLSMISLMLDYAVATPGDDLRSFHCTSLALHVANTALIIVLLYLLFGQAWIAAAVGLLFGVHPLTVEPVPWVGERKTRLAAFFVLWSLVLYVRFVRGGDRKFFVVSLVMYVLALLSKPTSTPLPVMMLLMDYWPLRRLRISSIWEKASFFVVGGISGVVTYISQARTASILTPEQYGLIRIPLVICHNIIFYLWKMLWPFRLTSHYPFPVPMNLSQPIILIGVIGTCVLIPALLISLRWTRAALTGWLIFFIMVLPTMQALQFSDVIASDKFVYLPSVGVLMILTVFLGWVCGRQHHISLKARYTVVSIVVLGLAGGEAVATRQYLARWRDTVSLWSHMVEVIPAISPRNNLGVAYAQAGDYDAAIEQFRSILEKDPNDPQANHNMGNILTEKGQFAEAEQYYKKAIRFQPTEADVYQAYGVLLVEEGKPEEAIALYRGALGRGKMGMAYLLHEGLGSVLLRLGRVDEAIEELKIAVKQRVNSEALGHLGLAMASKGEMEKAIEYYKKAIRIDTNNAEAHFNLGNAYLAQKKTAQAIVEYRAAIKARPNYTMAYSNLAVASVRIGRLDEAIDNFRRVVELEPNNPDGCFNLASALADKGLVDEAVEKFRKGIELSPRDAAAHYELGKLLLQNRKVEEAITEYEQAIKIDPNNNDARSDLERARSMQKSAGQPQPEEGGLLLNP